MPRICYEDKKFRGSSLTLIQQANDIIADYRAQGLSLTLRQLYYRFVAADLIPNTVRSYKRLGGIINDGRLAGLIDWNAIEDRGRNLIGPNTWDDASEIISACASQFKIDKWETQPYRVEVWVEKQALEAVIGQAADVWDVPYFACKGYTSQSEMWRGAVRFARYRNLGQKVVIIHLGDHDPSGIDMTRDISERINQLFGVRVSVDRIALNMNQIEEYKPPPNPAKMTDSRFEGYAAEFGDESWELDALEPATLNELIQDRIKKYLDDDEWEQKQLEEGDARHALQRIADNWSAVEDFVRDL